MKRELEEFDRLEKIREIRLAAQSRADEQGYPVQVFISIMNGDQLLNRASFWIYPIETWDQWRIVDGRPVHVDEREPLGGRDVR